MSTKTGISWTDATWNPLVGCQKVSQGCKFCYAKTLHDQRHRAFLAGKPTAPQYREPFETIQIKPERLTYPLSWREPRRIFVNSLSDLFHEDVPDDFIDRVFAVMALAPRHTFQLLTKRPERMRDYLRAPFLRERIAAAATPIMRERRTIPDTDVFLWRECDSLDAGQWRNKLSGIIEDKWPLPNVWLGVSVENQDAADERIPLLFETPAAVRFISAEPLLGPLDLEDWALCEEGYIDDRLVRPLDWVIVGGESGPKHRPMELGWLESVVRQCREARVPVFVKQDSGIRSGKQGRIPNELWMQQFPEARS